ncbi:MAG: type II toxin-antitoxin system RelE/ParE family toxin [Methylocystis sp.]
MVSKYDVLLTEGAEQDLEAIYDYIAEFEDPVNADHVLDQLIATSNQLAVMQELGSCLKELLDLGIKDYRQLCSKPYCLVYHVMGRDVVVFVGADGRRDMQSLLTRRLLGALSICFKNISARCASPLGVWSF